MTLGEKIREARRKCGLSQEQLAEKMRVSRSAVAKWETDKGLPDVGNLKILARLLSVSVDYLLDEEEEADGPVIREGYLLSAYGRGCKKVKKNRVVRQKFPDARIYALLGRQEFPGADIAVSSAAGCQAGAPSFAKNTDKEFYLVEREERQLFVTVTDEFVETRPLEMPICGSSFSLDGWNFIKSNYEVEM